MSWEKELEEKVSREKLSENLGGKIELKSNMMLDFIQLERELIY